MTRHGDIDDELPGAVPVSMPAGYDNWKLATPPEYEEMGRPPWIAPSAEEVAWQRFDTAMDIASWRLGRGDEAGWRRDTFAAVAVLSATLERL